VELSCNSTKKVTAATPSPSFFVFFTALQRNKEGDGSVAFFFSFFTALQRNEEGNNIWLVVLFPCNEVLCLFFPKSKIKYV